MRLRTFTAPTFGATAPLLIWNSKGQGPPRRAFGPNAIGSALTVAQALIEGNELEGYRKVIDLSADSASSWDGIPLAEARQSAEAVVEEALGAVDVPDGVKVERIVELGAAAGVLLDHHSDRLMVVGTRGQHAFGRALFGSVSQQVLHHTDDPVVVVP